MGIHPTSAPGSNLLPQVAPIPPLPSFPFSFPLFFLFLSLFLPFFTPFSSPKNSAMGLGEHCKLPSESAADPIGEASILVIYVQCKWLCFVDLSICQFLQLNFSQHFPGSILLPPASGVDARPMSENTWEHRQTKIIDQWIFEAQYHGAYPLCWSCMLLTVVCLYCFLISSCYIIVCVCCRLYVVVDFIRISESRLQTAY